MRLSWSFASRCIFGVAFVLWALPLSAYAECWVGIRLHILDDLRGGSATFANVEVLFQRGERLTMPLARAGVSIPAGRPAWRIQSPYDLLREVRLVTLTYRLDPGDGLLLKPDTWSFFPDDLYVYCLRPGAYDKFLSEPYSLDLDFSNHEPLGRRAGSPETLTGAGTLTLYSNLLNPVGQCRSDSDCADHRFCNGDELCRPGKPGSDSRGCRAGTPVKCGRDQTCFERIGCAPSSCAGADRDSDGYASIECRGRDCNDSDPAISPGNREVWDAQNRDEDCDLTTNGSAEFFNAAQVCDGENGVVLIPSLRRVMCPSGSVCVPQPSGGGVCAGRPDGYDPPPRFTAPQQQTGHPLEVRTLDQKITPSIIPPRIKPSNFLEH